ncbi:MAG: secretin and TonB N-terminal domain-containing protein, partial [Candidatus Aureabacteria bacterium]|nr:secretin and TonB N-terminal domain-containing protein [Candidatus Auribacterota bacterium]
MKKLVMLMLFVVGGVMWMTNVYGQDQGDEVVSGDKEGLVSFDFKDADVRNVLRIFSHKTGINIVAAPDVQGSVTVKLNNVPWEKALKVILEMNEFAFVRDENVIKVMTKAKIALEPLQTEVIPLNYTKASAVLPTLEGMKSERGQIKTDERANLLIITDVPSNFPEMKKVIERLDTPTPQVMIETKLIETTGTVLKKFGIKWSFLNEYEFKTNPFSKTFSETNRTVTEWEKAHEFIPFAKSDDPRYWENTSYNSVTGETTVDEFGYLVKDRELPGYEHDIWSFDAGGYTKGALNSDTITRTISTGISATGLSVLMSALMSDSGTDVLSAPSIVTMDNREANIKVAVDYPVPQFTYNQSIGTYEANSYTKEPVGITLKVTPHVAPNGYITLDLVPVVSSLDDKVKVKDVDLPVIAKEEISTTVMVKDGDTIV